MSQGGTTPVPLTSKMDSLKMSAEFEHKLIDSLTQIMQMKKKAESNYLQQLQTINAQLQKYIVSDNGFLTEIVKAYQAYITVMYANQKQLIQGYDKEILMYLAKAKEEKVSQQLISKANQVDKQFQICLEDIKKDKRLIRDNEEEIQMLNGSIKLGSKFGSLDENKKKEMSQKYLDLTKLKRQNEQRLEFHVDGLMQLSMSHHHTLQEIQRYQTIHLEQKGIDVYQNFMRAFVLEVSFLRSLQFDVGTILQKVKDQEKQNKSIAIERLRQKMQKNSTQPIWKKYIMGTYKKWNSKQALGDIKINQNYINNRIRQKWSKVCSYYDDAQ